MTGSEAINQIKAASPELRHYKPQRILGNIAIAVGELTRDYHVTCYSADKGFALAVLPSIFSIVRGEVSR